MKPARSVLDINLYKLLYDDHAYDVLAITLMRAFYYAARWGDEFTRYRFKHNDDALYASHEEFCQLLLES